MMRFATEERSDRASNLDQFIDQQIRKSTVIPFSQNTRGEEVCARYANRSSPRSMSLARTAAGGRRGGDGWLSGEFQNRTLVNSSRCSHAESARGDSAC
jgi:hypothetical protein